MERKNKRKRQKGKSKTKSIENSGKTMIKLQNVPKISQMKGRSRMVVD
jgi:hypothetical protein